MQHRRPKNRVFAPFLLAVFLTGCTSKHVVVQGNFPPPVIEKVPVVMGVLYPTEFAKHEIFDPGQLSGESDWRVSTGAAQIEFWDQFFEAMFNDFVSIQDWKTLEENMNRLDAVIVPRITDLQYTVPERTNVNVYEIQFFYTFEMVEPGAFHLDQEGVITFDKEQVIAAWRLVSYGKTPSAFIQTAEEAVNLAAVVSLRDAGANFAQNFEATPSIATWLDEKTNAHVTPPENQNHEKWNDS